MKKISLLSFLFFGLFNVYSQRESLSLTFQAKDSLTQNAVALDSVVVMNLTENCDTTLYDSVSVLTMNATWPVGIDESASGSSGSFILTQNVPNPFQGATSVSIYTEYQGPLNLLLFDGLGKKLAGYQNEFEKGFHSFVISSSGNRVLFLVVSDEKNHRSIKIVSIGQSNESSNIRYLGLNHPVEKGIAVNPDNSGFIFYLGNQLMYTAYANGYYNNTKFDNPTTSTTYIFTLTPLTIAVIPTVTTAAVTNITQTTATSGGTVTSDGGATVTARGVCWSISSNPTLADSHTTDGSGTGTFVSNLTGLNVSTVYYVRAYATNSVGTGYGNELTFTTLAAGFTCGDNITINHVAGNVAPVDKTTTYGTVTGIPGETSKCWITSNLGSDHQATAVNDATEASAGWYWQFNRKQGYKHDGTTRTPNTTWISSISENSDWITANDPCNIELGTTWRIPTYTEWYNVDNTGGWTNWNGPWGSGLKLHAAGYLSSSGGSLVSRGSGGNYLSSTQYSATLGWGLYFGSVDSDMSNYNKASGVTLRCIKE